MKIKFILPLLLLGLFSCEKDKTEVKDYRDEITGVYKGIKVNTSFDLGSDPVIYDRDTLDLNVTITLTSLAQDSIVGISFNPSYSDEIFTFKYIPGQEQLISLTGYHPPLLKVGNDSLYFSHQVGLGPNVNEFFAKKE